MNKQIKKLEIPQTKNTPEPGKELNADLLAAQELEDVEGGAWCDYGCFLACVPGSLFEL